MYGVLDWLLGAGALVLMVAFAFKAEAMVKVLGACLALARWLDRRGSAQQGWGPPRAELWGMALFFFLLVGVPILVVVWGYATGRLPAPSPYGT